MFNKKVQFLASFFLDINIFANTYIKNAQLDLLYQYMLLLTKGKQFSNLLKIKKEIGVTLLASISLFDMSMASLKAKSYP